MVRVGQKVKTLGSGENGDEGVWKEVRKRRLRLRGMSEYLDKGVVHVIPVEHATRCNDAMTRHEAAPARHTT